MKTQHHIVTNSGERYELALYLPPSKGWRSLNSVTMLCQIRASAAANAVVAVMVGTADVVASVISLVLTSTESAKLSAGVVYEWDLRLSWEDGDVAFPLGGTAKTANAVSRS